MEFAIKPMGVKLGLP